VLDNSEKIHSLVILRCSIDDYPTGESLLSEILDDFLKTAAGEFVTNHCKDRLIIHKIRDHSTMITNYTVSVSIPESKLTEYYLKFQV
jgi:hypothetical protein